MDEKHIIEVLKQVSLFSGMDKHHLGLISKIITVRQFEAGDTIVKQGDDGIGFYIVASGLVEIQKVIDGTPKKVAEIGEGEFFGELALFEETPRSATVIAAEPSTCYVITRWHFNGAIESNPTIAVHMLPVIAKRYTKAAHEV
ncbi:MAG: cyclic nucleotide-binding domain-containing protein [Chloroflexi bacterium]|uniref:Cyclic nucleotide-binding domain-containing protein n=1 Tax=Candidatus Chlorohelix allophototropha TaxID=3003348 RepID=A0A8T7LW49_9CHLR|nr:cyclic nucleotide-binding domain-containing protein [Chloroflexota bacterium]WJW67033.1 cyclic nucleotide-binding domain-containing protein [Chloroflexota bacterium L227-S17]